MSHTARHPAAQRLYVSLGAEPQPVARLGRYDYRQARRGLDPHDHATAIELCYLAKGHQTYQLHGRLYTLTGGDLFVTLPGEVHSTGGFPEEKGILYWLLVDLPADPAAPFLHYTGEAARSLREALLHPPRRHFPGSPAMQPHLDALLALTADPAAPLRDLRLHHHLVAFLLEAIRCAEADPPRRLSPALRELLAYVESHLAEPLPLADLARRMGLSLSRFKARFKRELGLPPGEYLARQRIAAAQRLLRGKRDITAIAFALGFTSSQYFATVFKRYTGQTPTAYRRAAQAGRSDSAAPADLASSAPPAGRLPAGGPPLTILHQRPPAGSQTPPGVLPQ